MEKMEVEAPIEKHTAGRLKKSRLLSSGEFRKYNVKYEKYCHNKKTCRNRVVLKTRKQ